MGGTYGAEQLNYRAASLRADAGRPSATAGVGRADDYQKVFWYFFLYPK
jgi:hypothetical protein